MEDPEHGEHRSSTKPTLSRSQVARGVRVIYRVIGACLVTTARQPLTDSRYLFCKTELPPGRKGVQGDAGPPAVGGPFGGQGQPMHEGSPHDGRQPNTGGVPAFLRCGGGFQAETSGRGRGERRARDNSEISPHEDRLQTPTQTFEPQTTSKAM